MKQTGLLLLALFALCGCAQTVTVRMDVLCVPVESGLACSDTQTWNEYIAKKRAERMNF